MNLSRRLERVVANVSHTGVVADIGCDHGFTAIKLVQTGRAQRAIAMDINEGPLQRASQHIAQYHMERQIQLRLSDGAKKLLPGEADTLVISGLGGALMAGILEEGKEVVHSVTELVLSPQSEIFLVREKLHELGFSIVHEEMLKDQGKFYVIIRAVPGKEFYRQEEYLFGRLLTERRDPVFRQYLECEEKRLVKVLNFMEEQSLSPGGQEEYKKRRKELEKVQAVLNTMGK